MENYTVSVASLPLSDNPIPNNKITKADLLPDPQSSLNSMEMKEKPIGDSTIPYRDLTNLATKKESIARIIDKLDVENNLRYQRTVEDTYCNVYSYDYCYFSKVYL
ncbi:MAG: hypothetical protein ABI892_09890, partial [Flavobacterium sp.]